MFSIFYCLVSLLCFKLSFVFVFLVIVSAWSDWTLFKDFFYDLFIVLTIFWGEFLGESRAFWDLITWLEKFSLQQFESYLAKYYSIKFIYYLFFFCYTNQTFFANLVKSNEIVNKNYFWFFRNFHWSNIILKYKF